MKASRMLVALAALVMIMSLSAGEALADRCGHYANRAYMQWQMAQRLGCNFSGGRWSSNKKAHRSWCQSVSADQSSREERIRNEDLDRCKKGKSWFDLTKGSKPLTLD